MRAADSERNDRGKQESPEPIFGIRLELLSLRVQVSDSGRILSGLSEDCALCVMEVLGQCSLGPSGTGVVQRHCRVIVAPFFEKSSNSTFCLLSLSNHSNSISTGPCDHSFN